MSHRTLYVRFPDGSVRYGLFHNTTDTPYSNHLFDTEEQAWDAWLNDIIPWGAEPEGEVCPVGISESRGWWAGTAARNMLVDDGVRSGECWGDDSYLAGYRRGLPLWAARPDETIDGGVVRRELGPVAADGAS
jgi:hypothetical protein